MTMAMWVMMKILVERKEFDLALAQKKKMCMITTTANTSNFWSFFLNIFMCCVYVLSGRKV